MRLRLLAGQELSNDPARCVELELPRRCPRTVT